MILPNTGGIPQLATETPASSPTPGTTPTLGTTPTPGASPTAAATATAPAGTSPTPAVTPTPEDRPQLFSEVLDAREISFAPETIAANMALSLVLVLLLIDVSLFNTTIKENEGVILGLFGGLFAPLKKVQDAWTKEDGETIFSRLLKPALVLGTSALIYCLLEPNLTVDRSSLILFLSLVLGIGIATYVYEGAQVFVSEKMFGLDAAIRFYPIAILISLLSVLFSKLTGLHPGVIFGFVAGAALVAHRNPEKHEDGLIIFLPMLAIFAVALVSWLLLSPIREMAEGGSFVGLVLEGAALSLFLGGIQGLLFSLIPLSFVDGEKVWRWSKLAWAAIAFPVGFLFFHVVVKQDGTLMSAIDSHGVTVLFIVAAVSWTITIGTWLFFKLTQGKAAA